MSDKRQRKKASPGYRKIDSVQLSKGRNGHDLMRPLNRYAKAHKMSVQDALAAILREVLSSWQDSLVES